MKLRWYFITFIFLYFLTYVFIGSGCVDRFLSSSIGSRRACSHHGGVSQLNKLGGIIVGAIGTLILMNYFPPKQKHDPQPERIEIQSPKRRRKKVITNKKKSTSGNPYTLYNFHTHKTVTPSIKKVQQNNFSQKKAIEVSSDKVPLCPQCGKTMRFQDARNYGFNFWGCVNYPSCKGIRKI